MDVGRNEGGPIRDGQGPVGAAPVDGVAHAGPPRLAIPLAIGIGLRLLLALVNREANDNHVAVISLIADKHSLPPLEACWACYHAKLYHLVCAVLVNLLGLRQAGARTVLAQLVSVAAGTGTLLVLRRFLRDRAALDDSALAARAGFWGFTLLALAPDMVGIDAQATNDSAVIFLSTLALWSLWRFLRDGARRHAAVATGAAALAAITKASGLVTLAVCITAVGVQWASRRFAAQGRHPESAGPPRSEPFVPARGPAHALALAMLLGASVLFVPFAGPYFSHWKRLGSPFVINVSKDAPAPLLVDDPIRRAGVTSVANAYFTFRFLDLLENPSITQRPEPVPFHRTSLWTQLYGRFHFSRFAQWPPSWATASRRVLALGRSIFILALLPTALALFGFVRALRPWFDAATGRMRMLAWGADWVFPLAACAFLAMLLKLTHDYRCFCTMKPIYLLPGVLAGLAFFVDGSTWFLQRIGRVRVVLPFWLGALAGLYMIDLLMLAEKLARVLALYGGHR
ncbi:MAG: hypothetical protein WCH13_07015 [Deltaproteobacteria bacterium]